MASKYHPIATRFWTDEKVGNWDDDTRLLALYLLSCPHRTAEGLFRLPKQYITADLKWSAERFAKPFAQLLTDGFLEYDETVSVILLRHALRYQPPANPNQEISAIRYLDELPQTPLLQAFQQLAEQYAERFAKRLTERYGKSLSLTLSLTPLNTVVRDRPDEPPDPPGELPPGGKLQGKAKHRTGRATKAPEYSPEFERFWSAYPKERRERKIEAFDCWNARLAEEVSAEDLIMTATNYAVECKGREKQHIKQPTTFLGPNERWKEHVDAPAPTSRPGMKQPHSSTPTSGYAPYDPEEILNRQ